MRSEVGIEASVTRDAAGGHVPGGGKRRLLIVGDSLAGGLPHLSFPAHLGRMLRDWEVRSSSRGGEVLIRVGARMLRLAALMQPDMVVLEGGGNDLLLPYLEERGGAWAAFSRNLQRGGNIPIRDEERFGQVLARLLQAASKLCPRVAVMNMTCLGEDLDSEINASRRRYNMVIGEAAASAGAELVDVASACEGALRSAPSAGTYLMDDLSGSFLDTFRCLTPGAALRLSRRRGLYLTIDGVHHNPRGASVIAATLAEAVSGGKRIRLL